MRRVRYALTALLLLPLALMTAGPASAGGPTSALIVNSATGQTASLYHVDDSYGALADQVGAFAPGGSAGTADQAGRPGEGTSSVTVTWLIHDVSVWRVDRVYLEAAGGPWIETQVDESGSGRLWDNPPIWHKASDGPALAALLTSLTSDAPSADARADAAAAAAAAAADTAVAPGQPREQRADQSSTSRLAGWVWGLAGLALGAALMLLTVLTVRRVARPGPASVDAESSPEPSGPAGPSLDLSSTADNSDADRAMTDELTWPALRR